MNCTPATLEFYKYTAGAFLSWVEAQGVTGPEEVTGRLLRQYLAGLLNTGRKDTTLHANARAIRTLLRFWHTEKYIPEPIHVDMPKLEKKRLPVLSTEQLQQVVKACNVRDRAIVLFMVDSGLRRKEMISLNWGDVDMQTGLVRVKQGKGKKDRSAVVGAKVRRALLAYRRQFSRRRENSNLPPAGGSEPLFQTREGTRFASDGFIQIFNRIKKQTGIHVSPHVLRRTWTILCLRAGMDPLHLQALGGWTSLSMVEHYAQMVDDDLLQAHAKYSPVDRL